MKYILDILRRVQRIRWLFHWGTIIALLRGLNPWYKGPVIVLPNGTEIEFQPLQSKDKLKACTSIEEIEQRYLHEDQLAAVRYLLKPGHIRIIVKPKCPYCRQSLKGSTDSNIANHYRGMTEGSPED